MASEKYQQMAVLTSSTIAFTVCFMVWMMFAVLGIPIQKTLGLNNTEFGPLGGNPCIDRLGAIADWADDGQIRRPHCVFCVNAHHGDSHLCHGVCQSVLAFFGVGLVCGLGGRFVYGWDCLCGKMVPTRASRLCHGGVWGR